MNCKPTLKGLELCIKNSTRLLEDACSENLSLPTIGALIEIGLEEFAKAFLMMICLYKSQKLPKTIKGYSNASIPSLIEKAKELYNQIDCDEIITLSFKDHKPKTQVVHIIWVFICSIPQYFENVKGQMYNFVSDSFPAFTQEQFENILSRPEVKTGFFMDLDQTDIIMNNFSSKIKESGFYVNCNNGSYEYPEVPKKNIEKMADFLYAGIFALNYILGENLPDAIKLVKRNTKAKLDQLKSKLK